MTNAEQTQTGAPYEGSAQAYDVIVERDVRMPLRDGAVLSMDLYRPARGSQPIDGPLPVLLERTPYDKYRTPMVSVGRYFARRGYIVVIQDVRGTYASDGEWWAFADEGEDGYDTIEWIAQQPWCNGKIGTFGLSYSASNQSATASLNPPHLSAMVVTQGMSNYHTVGMRQGGALEGRFFVSWFMLAARSKEAIANRLAKVTLTNAFANVKEWITRAPYREGSTPLRHAPIYERWLLKVQAAADYDEFWMARGLNIEPYYDEHADVPTLLIGGWFDTYTRSTTDNFIELRARKNSPISMLMGPWIHGTDELPRSWAGDVDFGPEAALDDYHGLRLRWFDAALRGQRTGAFEEPPVRLFVMGGGGGYKTEEGRLFHGGAWRDEPTWPLERASATAYYLHADGALTPDPPAEDVEPSRYTYDPANPVPTIGGNFSAAPSVLPAGAFDQRGRPGLLGCKDTLPLSTRHDVLVFQTPPLPEDLEVTGPISVTLWVASSAVDTDFTAKLIDVYPPNPDYPDGYAMNLADSIIRARYRDSRERASMLTPHEIVQVTIVLNPTCNRFVAGHQIRLDISSSNFPRFDVNPNTGGPLGVPGPYIVAQNAVYHDQAHPSHVVLPIVPV